MCDLSLGTPNAVGFRRDLVEVATGRDAQRLFLGDRFSGLRVFIAFLEKKPGPLALFGFSASFANEHPASVELFTVEDEFQMAFLQSFGPIADRLPEAFVPDHHGPAAIFALGNDPLEAAVFDRVIFDLHGQALVAGIEIGALGNCPALQHAVQLKAEVVMKV